MIEQAVFSGLLTGSLFGLIAIGLTLIWGIMKIVNFAHGEYLMVGLYVAYFLITARAMDPYATLLITPVVLFALGALTYRLVIRHVLQAPAMNQILLTVGLSLVLQNLALAIASANVLFAPSRYTTMVWRLGGLVLDVPRVVAALIALVTTAALYAFLHRTDTGLSIRAIAQDHEAARLMGIDVHRTNMLAFGLGTGVLGVAASAMSTFYYASPTVGLLFGLMAFIIVVLGGLGNVLGAFVGGLVIGVTESVGAALLPGSLARVITFALFVLILLFRPQGLFGRVAE